MTYSKKIREQVEQLSGFGLTQQEIAVVVGLSSATLRRRFKKELKNGSVKADAQVLTNLHRIATGSTPQAVSAAIFWTKVRRRWHEVKRVIHGFDPDVVMQFVGQVVAAIKRRIPDTCPHCKTNLELKPALAAELKTLSMKMREQLPPAEIVPTTPADVGAPGGDED